MSKFPVVTMVLIGRAGIYDARKKCFYHGEWMNSMQGKKVCVLKDAFLPSSLHCFDSAMKFLGSANAKKAGKSITIHSQNICHLLTKRSCN